jgi:hypothetical protein
MIRKEKTTANNTSFHVYYNDIYLGDAEQDESGYYNFWFSKDNSGYWSSYSLELISKELREMNEEWDRNVKLNLVDKKN